MIGPPTIQGSRRPLVCLFGVLGTLPVRPGTQKIYKLTPGHHVSVVASGLTFPTVMTFDPDGYALYVSNFGFGVPVPDAGQIVRIANPANAGY